MLSLSSSELVRYGFGPGFEPWMTRPLKRSLSVVFGTP